MSELAQGIEASKQVGKLERVAAEHVGGVPYDWRETSHVLVAFVELPRSVLPRPRHVSDD